MHSANNSYLIEKNDFKYNDDYESVMQFIKKQYINKDGTTIPEFLEAFYHSPDDQANIERLMQCIQKGDLGDEIFYDPLCQLYAVYLLKEKRISIETFLSINIYLIAVMQFSPYATLKGEDQDVKILNSTLEVLNIDDEKLQDDFIQNLRKKHFTLNSQPLNVDELKKKISALSSLEKNVIRLPIKIEPFFGYESGYKTMMSDIGTYSPFVFKKVVGQEIEFYFPLAGVTQLFLETINPENPIKMAPIFGRIGLLTLFKMHQRGFHPVSLYSCFVKNNVNRTHNLRCGPLPLLLHDNVVHVYWGNLLTSNEHKFIFEYLIPKFANILNIDINSLNDDRDGFHQLIDLLFINQDKKSKYKKLSFAEIINKLLHINGDDNLNARLDVRMNVRLIESIYKEKDMIRDKYGINFKKLLKDPYFITSGEETFGSLILTILKEAKEKNIPAAKQYRIMERAYNQNHSIFSPTCVNFSPETENIDTLKLK